MYPASKGGHHYPQNTVGEVSTRRYPDTGIHTKVPVLPGVFSGEIDDGGSVAFTTHMIYIYAREARKLHKLLYLCELLKKVDLS